MKKGKQKVDTIEKLASLMADCFSDVTEKFAEIDTRFDAIDTRFDAIDARFDAIDARFDRVDEELHSIRTEVSDILRRIARLEDLGARHAGYSKEIDFILQRVSNIEKHIGISK